MIYNSNEQLVTELKKLLLDTKCSQRDIAKQMGISPQALQNLLNKKQLSFADLKRVLDCINCDLLVDFSVRPISVVQAAGEPINGYIKIPDTQKPDPAATMDRQSIPTNGPSVKDLKLDPATDPSGSSPHHYETLEEKLERMRKAHVSQEE